MEPLISVIVPVYNAEKYLNECIRSILNQTLKNVELLLVDDGSTDHSGEICDRYAKQNRRIRVFHKKNQGVTSARRIGVASAKGKYICFVDADDTLKDNALETLMEKMTNNIDVVISDSQFEKVITGVEFLNRLLLCELPVSLWGKLYRKTIFDHADVMNIRREIYMGEDSLTNMKASFYVNQAYCFSKHVYLYRDNPSSVSHKRKYSLKYEEMFRKEVENIVTNKEQDGLELAWYRFQLGILKGLITNKIDFSYNIPWIKNLLGKRIKGKIAFREWVVLNVHTPILCRFIFNLADGMINLWSNNE